MQLHQENQSNLGQYPPDQPPNSDKQFGQTSLTDRQRRQYPRDIQGAKDEWKGMVKHQDEIKDSLRNVETEIKHAKQDDLRMSFLQAEKEKLEKKQYELQLKQQEFLEKVQQYQQYQQDLQRNKQDKAQFQQHLASNYADSMNQKQEINHRSKQEQLAYEQQQINLNRQKLENDRMKRMQQKNQDKEDAMLQLKLADQKKQQEKQNYARNKDEYNQLMHENQLKEMMKEENYKNVQYLQNQIFFQYYLRCAEFQGKNQEMHQQQVYNSIQQKNSQIQSIIDKNVEQAKSKQYQDELNRLQSRYNDAMDTKSMLQNQMSEKQHFKDLERLEKQIKVDQRLKDLSNYQQYMQAQKEEKFQRQNEYQNYLRQQMAEQNAKNLNCHRMTKDEKKFNFLDLQAYKIEDPGLYSMLPGWSPQIGGLTNNQKRQYFMEQRAQAQANKSTDLSPKQERSPSEFTKFSKGVMTMAGVNPAGKRALQTNQSVENNRNDGKQQFQQQQFQPMTDKNATGKKIDFGKLYGDENQGGASTFPNRQEQKSNIFHMQRSYGTPQYVSHNPITNPVPNNMQNPYILRQYKTQFSGNQSQLNNNSNIFQNAGTSLIGGQ